MITVLINISEIKMKMLITQEGSYIVSENENSADTLGNTLAHYNIVKLTFIR